MLGLVIVFECKDILLDPFNVSLYTFLCITFPWYFNVIYRKHKNRCKITHICLIFIS